MSEAQKTETEQALHDLEEPKHHLARTQHDLITAENYPAPANEKLKAHHEQMLDMMKAEHEQAKSAYDSHVTQHGGERDLHRKIDLAAQKVLDERGHTHSEKGILTPEEQRANQPEEDRAKV